MGGACEESAASTAGAQNTSAWRCAPPQIALRWNCSRSRRACASEAHLDAQTQACLSGCCPRAGPSYRWFHTACEVYYRSSADGTLQPAMFVVPHVAAKDVHGAPLLVGLHAWSELHTNDRLNLLGQ